MGEKRIPFRDEVFVEDRDGKSLLANKCKSCGQIFFPKVHFCFNCMNEDMEGMTLSHRGRLNTYTIGNMASMQFQPPYAIGFIDMPEGIRIFAPLKMVVDKPFKIGMEMEMIIEMLWQEDDKQIMGYMFKPL